MQQLMTKILAISLGVGSIFTRTVHGSEDSIPSLWTGSEANFGGILFPHFHVIGAVGGSTGDPATLSLGAHDPQQEHVDLLALEPGMSLRLGNHLEGFITSSYITDALGDFTGGVEEAFLKLADLPGGLELRGGRFFNRVGFQNAVHSHSWSHLDQHLVNARLLQEGELATIGGEVTWHLPPRYPAALSFGLGAPPSGHGHGGEDEHGHGHGHEESVFEPDLAYFDDYIFTANLAAVWRYNDFHQLTGSVSYSLGENGFDGDTQVFGLGLEYLWRENGLEPGGRYFRWRSEAMLRDIEASAVLEHHDEEEEEEEEHGEHEEELETVRGTFDEFGIYSVVTYGFDEHLEASLRADYIQGIEDLGLDERWRISPALTWSLNRERTAYLRLQYNYDRGEDFGEEHSIWLGLGINWGGSEVR